jgi:hypothetical protein
MSVEGVSLANPPLVNTEMTPVCPLARDSPLNHAESRSSSETALERVNRRGRTRALLCIQSGDSLKNPNHWKFDTDQFFFKSPAAP